MVDNVIHSYRVLLYLPSNLFISGFILKFCQLEDYYNWHVYCVLNWAAIKVLFSTFLQLQTTTSFYNSRELGVSFLQCGIKPEQVSEVKEVLTFRFYYNQHLSVCSKTKHFNTSSRIISVTPAGFPLKKHFCCFKGLAGGEPGKSPRLNFSASLCSRNQIRDSA